MYERDKKTRLRHVALELGGHGLPRSREEAMAMLAEVGGLLGNTTENAIRSRCPRRSGGSS